MNRQTRKVKKFKTGGIDPQTRLPDPRSAAMKADEWKVGMLAAGHTTRTIHPHGDDHDVLVEVY